MTDEDRFPSWSQCAARLEWDGGFRDIYVLNTDRSDWDALLAFLDRSEWPVVFKVNDEPKAIPSDTRQVFELRDELDFSLSVVVGRALLHFHFFAPSEIECDLDPRDVRDESDWKSLLEFMARVGRHLEKDVRLTDENGPEDIIVRYVFAQDTFRCSS